MAGPRPTRQVLIVELHASLLVQDDEGPPSGAQLPFVGLDYIERGEAMAALVLDEIAMSAVEPLRQGPECPAPR